MNQPKETSTTPTRLPYATPQLRDHGDASELTQTNAPHPPYTIGDGGTPINFYMS